MWLAAMDERIRLAVISGYIHGYYDSILECHLCPCNYAPSLWLLGDISDICALIAPRPLFAENGTEDVKMAHAVLPDRFLRWKGSGGHTLCLRHRTQQSTGRRMESTDGMGMLFLCGPDAVNRYWSRSDLHTLTTHCCVVRS